MLWSDTRGSSLSIEYALTLLIAFSVLGGVSVAIVGTADSNEQLVTENQLDVAGNEIAAQLEHQQMLRQEYEDEEWLFDSASDPDRKFATTSYVKTPKRTASGTYTAQIASDGGSIVLEPAEGNVRVDVPIRDTIPVAESSGAPGGAVMIEYDTDADEFVLRSGDD